MPDTLHVLMVEARFYEAIAEELVAGAVAVLEGAGASHERIVVPGRVRDSPALSALPPRR